MGRAAIIGWRDVLAPAVRTFGPRLRVWPFSGPFASYTDADCIIVETYPADACLQIGLSAPGRGWSKRRQDDRAIQAGQILLAAQQASVALSGELGHAISNGFGSKADGEDAFDAVVGLIAMARELSRQDPGNAPLDRDVQDREGWIFGQPAVAA